LKVSSKDKFDHKKQIRALMPNLIHSLDAYSITELYNLFSLKYDECQFYSIQDCFGTTCDKVETLKTLLVFVYVDLYSDNNYLVKFDNNIIKYIIFILFFIFFIGKKIKRGLIVIVIFLLVK
jgi:DNA-directed RNA polymerase